MTVTSLGMPQALLLPDKTSHTRLELQPEALATLRNLNSPVAIVSVVGAYRTGKSWLLNEMMQSGCDGGFIVGHERHTQTKGVWIQPTDGAINGTTRIYMDTEGFEGTGQAEVYDDRIFAFAALVSSVLVYNLAETIKQADIERLAFASTLSAEFWKRTQHSAAGDASSDGASSSAGDVWTPPALLWLVQRDFLQGGSVDSYLQAALEPTAGNTDEHATRLNKVREALKTFGHMRAMGLVQPHVRRTELCSLPRSSFDPEYLTGATAVRGFVTEHAHSRRPPPSVELGRGGGGRGDERNGAALASLITQIVDALNAQEIPTAGSVVDAFNARLVQTSLQSLQAALRALPLPVEEAELEAVHDRLLTAAQRTLHEQSFGASEPVQLISGARDALRALNDANFVASQRVCDSAWSSCQAAVRSGGAAWLPSTSRYAARLAGCNTTLHSCIGPAARRFHEVLLPTLAADGTADYLSSYRDKLHRALVIAMVIGVLVSRFLLKSHCLELLCALGFVCLELLPALPFGFAWVGASPRAQQVVEAYEALVFNSVWDLNYLLPVVAALVPLILLARRCVRAHQRSRGGKRALKSWGAGGVVGGGGGGTSTAADLTEIVLARSLSAVEDTKAE